jgi:hypothetical protein
MAMRSFFEDWAADTGISKWTLTGTTREGKSVEVQGCDFCTSRAGKVIRKDSYWKIIDEGYVEAGLLRHQPYTAITSQFHPRCPSFSRPL